MKRNQKAEKAPMQVLFLLFDGKIEIFCECSLQIPNFVVQ